jgi:hypothetical protein
MRPGLVPHGPLDPLGSLCRLRVDLEQLVLSGVVKRICEPLFDFAVAIERMVQIPPCSPPKSLHWRYQIVISKLGLNFSQVHDPVIVIQTHHEGARTDRDVIRYVDYF